MTTSTGSRDARTVLPYLLSVVAMVAVWAVLAACINAPLILPSPLYTAKTLLSLLKTSSFWAHILKTILRSLIAFSIATVSGCLVGMLCGSSTFLARFFYIPVQTVRATPIVAIILTVMFWFTSNTVPVFVAVLASFPIMVSSVAEGFKSKDKKLLEMANAFSLTKMQIFRYVTLPAVIPFFASGAVATFGLTWKAVVAAEVLCLPRKGAGFLLQSAQAHLETATVISISLVLVVLCFSMQKAASVIVRRLLNAKQ